MAKRMVLILCLLTITIYTPREIRCQLSGNTIDRMKTGLEAGKNLADTLKDGNFHKSLVELGTKLSPFLNVVGPLASVAFSFLPTGDSAELAFMKKKFEEVNNKLDIVIAEFDEVKRAIDWNAVEISYGQYERNIQVSEEDLYRVYSAEKTAFETEKSNFLRNFEMGFDSSLQKLYNAVIRDDLFSKNILNEVIKYTKNHKRKFEQFSLGLVQLLLKGIEVQISYYALSEKPYDHIVKEWEKKMQDLSETLRKKSNGIKNAYLMQLHNDAEGLIRDNYDEGNEQLMQKVYNFVIDKFDWRYWFVAVYDDMKGYDKHTMYQCGGAYFLHMKGRNIIISSQHNRYSSQFKKKDAQDILEDVENDVDSCQRETRNARQRAKTLFDRITTRTGTGCVPYALKMAVKKGNGLQYTSLTNHLAYKKIDKRKYCKWSCSFWKGCNEKTISWGYNLIIFG